MDRAGAGAGRIPVPPCWGVGEMTLGLEVGERERCPLHPSAECPYARRFGRETRGSAGPGAEARLSARGWDLPAPQFWSMAAPQRFGRRK